jgi:hypothetical protein
MFRALVTCGYSQHPGLDFQELCSPVINDPVFEIVFICLMVWGFITVWVDIEVAFLHIGLKELIYIEFPDRLVHPILGLCSQKLMIQEFWIRTRVCIDWFPVHCYI